MINKKPYIYYSFLYLIVAVATAVLFISQGKSFVWLDDGISQSIVDLKTSVSYLFYDYANYGLVGNNVIYNFFYWGLRSLPGVLFSEDSIVILYIALYAIQIYFSGFFFISFLNSKFSGDNTLSPEAVVAGALMYAFSGYSIFTLLHPDIAYATMMLPLVLIGADRIREGKSGLFFSVVVFLVIAFNSIYIYTMTLILGFYYLIGINHIKEIFNLIKWWLLGVLLGGFMLLPVALGLSGSSRIDGSIPDSLVLFPKEHYTTLIGNVFSPGVTFAMATIAFIGFVALILKRKKTKEELQALIALLLFGTLYLTPIYWWAAKGFTNIDTFCTFGPTFFAIYGACVGIDIFLKAKNIQRRIPLIAGVIFTVAYIGFKFVFGVNAYPVVFMTVTLAVCVIIMMLESKGYKNGKSLLFLSLVTLNVTTLYLVGAYRRIDEFLDIDTSVSEYYGRYEDSAAIGIKEDGFYRVEKYDYDDEDNTNLYKWYEYNGTSVFHSALNGDVTDYMVQTENVGLISNNKISGFDSRIMADDLANVRYVIMPGGDIKPTQSYVPFGFTYKNDEAISENEAEKYNGLQKQEVMMQVPIVEEGVSEIESLEYEMFAVPTQYRITKESEKNLTYTITHPKNCELYVRFTGLSDLDERIEIVANGKSYTKELQVYGKDNVHNVERDAVLMNIGYMEKEGDAQCTIYRSKPDIYDNANIEFYAQPLDNIDSYRQKLKEESLIINKMGYSRIDGSINVSRNKWLCLSLPYNSGWEIYIDGKKATKTKINYMYLGTIVPPGEHEITLRYHLPKFREGVCMSLAGVIIVSVILIRRRKYAKAV